MNSEVFPFTTDKANLFDYLYSAEDLTELRGKKFSGQRNHVSQFMRNCEDWCFKDIHDVNIADVISFFVSGYHAAENPSEFEKEENDEVLEVLNNLDQYAMLGGVLHADGEIVGFSLGEIQNDTLFTHIEKADRNCKGAYPMLVNQFSKYFAGENIKYINREEDMGDIGLRTSKMSYHPVAKLKKYIVEIK